MGGGVGVGGQSDGARGLQTKRNKRFHGYEVGKVIRVDSQLEPAG